MSCARGILERFITIIPNALKYDGITSLMQQVNAIDSEADLKNVCAYIVGYDGLKNDFINQHGSACFTSQDFEDATTTQDKKSIFKACILKAYVERGGLNDEDSNKFIDNYMTTNETLFETSEPSPKRQKVGGKRKQYVRKTKKYVRKTKNRKTKKRNTKNRKTKKRWLI
jgi:hypothetical protein